MPESSCSAQARPASPALSPARALLVTWQGELLRFVFFHPSWHHACATLFFFLLVARTIGSGPLRLLLQNTWLDQIPSHCFVKTVFNATTKHRVSYWVTPREPFSILWELPITLCAGGKKKLGLGMAYLRTGFWGGAGMVARRKTSNMG